MDSPFTRNRSLQFAVAIFMSLACGVAATAQGRQEVLSQHDLAWPPAEPTRQSRLLNIGFAHDPGPGHYDGVVGTPGDVWNFVSVGTTAKDFMRFSDQRPSKARLRIARHDGAWGIAGQSGIFHGYIYDNCRCKDLDVTLFDLEPGRYRAYVYAHGDAPDQNARIELLVGAESLGQKATANDGTGGYRKQPMSEGVQYVTFDFDVWQGNEVKFISHRDGSSYSMFNAIQLVPLGRDAEVGVR
ncbi:hypothetical protein Mal15_13060 [Stieleria maiorica]|uniref:Uncharacterized protein n=1 Tax=Stieleria maiorica TaxID=2795974 RepID=A0A5B9MDE2_9BACT|nr:hypothetical protein [Stieleria maiorica]QEF97267.1 hypothetical protein Mal15_13060 [Stieleria maiorica]